MASIRIPPGTPGSTQQKSPVRSQPAAAAPFSARPPPRQPEAPAAPPRPPVRKISSAGRKGSAADISSDARQLSTQSRESDGGCGLFSGLGLMDRQGGSADGQDDSPAESGKAGEVAETVLDSEELLDSLPTGGDTGIFEVLLPGGETLGVMVDVHPASVSYLITPGSDKLRGMLRGKKMELEQGLERRMHRNIKLTVL